MQTQQQPPRLLERVRVTMRLRRMAKSSEQSYLHWIREYLRYHRPRHPREMGRKEVEAFLSHLSQRRYVSRSTQNQALSALLFLYNNVLDQPLDDRVNAVRAKRRRQIPVVLHPTEVRRLLSHLSGTPHLIAQLLYGAGLRIDECLSLRIHQVDFVNTWIILKDAKGGKDRITLLPKSLIPTLANHIVRVKRMHDNDLHNGLGQAFLPGAFHLKNPGASRDFRWQFLFPSDRVFYDEKTGNAGRWHVHADTFRSVFQSAVRECGFTKRVTPHTLRHSFATHILASGCDVRLLQSLLGHNSLSTTMLYAHMADHRLALVDSPLDVLA